MLNRVTFFPSFVTVIFIFVFGMTSVLTADVSYARQRERTSVKSRQVNRRGDRQYSRRDMKRRVISPRAARRGHVVPRLPRGYRRTWYKKVPYYYYSGVFYRPAPSGYIVVGPPIGAVVVTLPIGYTSIWIGGMRYYSYGGVFYRRVPAGYVVVDTPSEVVVEEDAPVIVQPTEAASGKATVTASVLNVRTGPGLSYPVIYQIHEGYIVEIQGRELGWLYVQLPNGEFGWVMKGFVSPLESPGSG